MKNHFIVFILILTTLSCSLFVDDIPIPSNDSKGGAGADVDLANYYTKAETDSTIDTSIAELIGYDAEGSFRYVKIDNVKTKLYTKILTGTLDSDSTDQINHGISDAATKIMNVFNDYFDLASFSSTKGYFNELLNSIKDDKSISKEDLKKLLTKGKLNPEALEDEEFIWRHV